MTLYYLLTVGPSTNTLPTEYASVFGLYNLQIWLNIVSYSQFCRTFWARKTWVLFWRPSPHLLKMTLNQGPRMVLRRALQYLKVFGIILQIPFLFLAYIILNTLKRIAPKLLFKFITSNVLSKINLQSWKNFSNISSVDDLDFLFSVDIFKVGEIILILPYELKWHFFSGKCRRELKMPWRRQSLGAKLLIFPLLMQRQKPKPLCCQEASLVLLMFYSLDPAPDPHSWQFWRNFANFR